MVCWLSRERYLHTAEVGGSLGESPGEAISAGQGPGESLRTNRVCELARCPSPDKIDLMEAASLDAAQRAVNLYGGKGPLSFSADTSSDGPNTPPPQLSLFGKMYIGKNATRSLGEPGA